MLKCLIMEKIIGERLSMLIDVILKMNKKEFAYSIGVEHGRTNGIYGIIKGSLRIGKNYDRIKRTYPEYWDWLTGESDIIPEIEATNDMIVSEKQA